MPPYEYRSSDLDFALFLADCDIRKLIPERWVERPAHLISNEEFAKEMCRFEKLVSPDLVDRAIAARKARYRHRDVSRSA